jgi:hypothetical protein
MKSIPHKAAMAVKYFIICEIIDCKELSHGFIVHSYHITFGISGQACHTGEVVISIQLAPGIFSVTLTFISVGQELLVFHQVVLDA